MTDLTEQWKKGELPEGWYYVKCDDGICFDRFTYYGGFSKIFNYSIKQILAPVPTFDELQSMNEAVNQAMAANIKLVEQNAQLKELLKELIEKDIGTICDLKSILERMNYGGAEYDTLKNIIHDFETDINRYEDKINEI